jgi:hypothetical protein
MKVTSVDLTSLAPAFVGVGLVLYCFGYAVKRTLPLVVIFVPEGLRKHAMQVLKTVERKRPPRQPPDASE